MLGEPYINPVTRDYALEAGGDLQACDDLGNEVFKRINQIAGESPLEPTVGRAVRERLKDLPETRRLLLKDFRAALQPILDEGRAASLEVWEDETETRPGLMRIEIEAVDPGGDKTTYSQWVTVS